MSKYPYWRVVIILFLLVWLGVDLVREARSYKQNANKQIENMSQALTKAGMPFSQEIEIRTTMQILAIENTVYMMKMNGALIFFILEVGILFLIPNWVSKWKRLLRRTET